MYGLLETRPDYANFSPIFPSQLEQLMTLPRAPHFSQSTDQALAAEAETPALGQLPEWDLTDLYKSTSCPEVERDLAAAKEKAAEKAKRL